MVWEMMLDYPACLAWTWLPQNDGQPYHVDSGGGTAWAVRQVLWAAWVAAHPDMGLPLHVADASQDQLSSLLLAWFWKPVDGQALPSGLNLMVWDFGVNAGPGRSAMILQKLLGVAVDGDIGPHTLRAVYANDAAKLCNSLHDAHADYYRALPGAASEGGWFSRNDAALAVALQSMQAT
jgi:lysozyme family protein